jgi:hypothetical protein
MNVVLSSWKRECILDGVHATSWATCVSPITCNLTQELSRDGGLTYHFSILHELSGVSASASAYAHAFLKTRTMKPIGVFP